MAEGPGGQAPGHATGREREVQQALARLVAPLLQAGAELPRVLVGGPWLLGGKVVQHCVPDNGQGAIVEHAELHGHNGKADQVRSRPE